MQNKVLTGKIKERLFARHALTGSIIAMAIFMFGFVFLPYLIVEANAAQEVSVGTNWVATSLTLDPDYGNGSIGDTGHGDVEFGEITPTSTTENNYGTQRVIRKQIGIESSGRYYTVYLSMNDDSNALKFGGTDSNIKIDPVNGTWTDPVDFSDGTGWGFAVPGTTISGVNSQNQTVTPSFSQATTFSDITKLGVSLTYAENPSVYNQDTWVAVPVLGSAQQIWKATTTNSYGFGGENGDTTNDHFSVYYGVMVGSDVLAGTYENEIVYTALASSKSLDEVSNNLLVTERFVASGTVETLTFDVTLSTAGLIAPNQIVAYVVPHADAVAGVSTLNTNKTSYSICAGSGTNGVLTSADVDFGETGTTITCTMPAKTPAWDGTTGSATDGLYDIWVSIPDYSANYISKTTGASSARVASVVYAGLQSLEQTGTDSNDQPIYEPYFSEMQDMTGTVCANTNMWGSGTGSDAIIYDYQGEQLEEGVATGTALPGAGADTLGVSSFKLLDNRDSKPYLVRRLADGNCWMVQNLDLNLADFAGTQSLTPANTDISYGLASTDPGYRSSWDPSKSMYDYAKAIDSTVETGQTSYFPVASLSLLGTAQNYQFQPRETSGANYRWGSLLNESGEAIVDDPSDTTKALNPSSGNSTATKNGSVWVENNSRAAFPRSYDNGYDWVDQSAYATAAGYTTGDAVNGGHTSLASEDWSFAHATTYLGDYYNWYAATAESGTWNDTSGNMQDSICPKGWSLPENADTNHRSWNYLLKTTYTVINTAGDQTVTSRNKYGNAYSPSLAMHEIPLSVVFSGDYYWVNGGLGSRGTYGYFWSSTPYATTYARYLAFSSTSVYPQGGNNKTYGFTIRCVAR